RLVAVLLDGLRIHEDESTARQRHGGVGGNHRVERRRQLKAANQARLCRVLDVEDDKAGGAVGEERSVADDVRRVEARAFGDASFASGPPLAWHPPPSDAHRSVGVGEIHDLVDVTVETVRSGSQVDVAAAVEEIPMGAVASGAKAAYRRWVSRCADVPDDEAF